MAMLVHAVCGTCGERVRPKSKTSKLYVHVGVLVGAADTRVTMADWLARHGDDHAVTSIRMVTDRERY